MNTQPCDWRVSSSTGATLERRRARPSARRSFAGFTNHPLRTDVEAGLRQLEVGQSRPFDDDAVGRIKKAGRAKLAALKARKP
jgi:hypothetical protein